jgi:hypothetical protein
MASLSPLSASAFAAIAAMSPESAVGNDNRLCAGGMVIKNNAAEMTNIAVIVRTRILASLENCDTPKKLAQKDIFPLTKIRLYGTLILVFDPPLRCLPFGLKSQDRPFTVFSGASNKKFHKNRVKYATKSI